ncbi:hypothetical protein R1flu_007595 [Riccia fluitans]|uniref:Maturase K n=1 Tax=Riccia fluitans TaxID=41844 RepID=A0ABD1YZD8_9MARC
MESSPGSRSFERIREFLSAPSVLFQKFIGQRFLRHLSDLDSFTEAIRKSSSMVLSIDRNAKAITRRAVRSSALLLAIPTLQVNLVRSSLSSVMYRYFYRTRSFPERHLSAFEYAR